MTLFRLLLLIITLLIILKLFHKILVKRDIVEGITSGDKKNEMDALNSLYGTGIKLSPYSIKNSVSRPVPISPSLTAANARDIVLKAQYQGGLVAAQTNLHFLRIVQVPTRRTPPTMPTRPVGPIKPSLPSTSGSFIQRMRKMQSYQIQLTTYQVQSAIFNQRNNLYTQQMRIYNDTVKANNTAYDKARSIYDDYIRRRNDYNGRIAQFTQLISDTQTRINNYNCSLSAYKVALDDYNRLNDDGNYLNFRLKDLFIKSSFNSAFTGTCMNIDMIIFVLNRGCRYIDFEISKIDDVLYVSGDGLDKENSITLVDAIGSINKSLIGTDPLFINLRLIDPQNISFTDLQSALSSLTTARLRYDGRRIDDTTRISEVMNKCVVISDRDIKSSAGVSVVDMVVNENGICAYLNSEIQSLTPVGKDCESKRLTVVNPDIMRSGILSWLDPAELNLKLTVTNYRVNIIPYRFYLKSNELDSYEYIFNDNTHTIMQQKYLDTAFFEKMEKSMDQIGQNI